MVTVRFIPQVWTGLDRDYAMTVEPSPGPDTWQVPAARVAGIQPRSHEADHLAREDAAPAWVRAWP